MAIGHPAVRSRAGRAVAAKAALPGKVATGGAEIVLKDRALKATGRKGGVDHVELRVAMAHRAGKSMATAPMAIVPHARVGRAGTILRRSGKWMATVRQPVIAVVAVAGRRGRAATPAPVLRGASRQAHVASDRAKTLLISPSGGNYIATGGALPL